MVRDRRALLAPKIKIQVDRWEKAIEYFDSPIKWEPYAPTVPTYTPAVPGMMQFPFLVVVIPGMKELRCANTIIDAYDNLKILDPLYYKFLDFPTVDYVINILRPFKEPFKMKDLYVDALRRLSASSPIYLWHLKSSLEQRIVVPPPIYSETREERTYRTPQISELEPLLIPRDQIISVPSQIEFVSLLSATAVNNAAHWQPNYNVVPFFEKAHEILNSSGDVEPSLLDLYDESIAALNSFGLEKQIRTDPTLFNKVTEVSMKTKEELIRRQIDVSLLEETLKVASQARRST